MELLQAHLIGVLALGSTGDRGSPERETPDAGNLGVAIATRLSARLPEIAAATLERIRARVPIQPEAGEAEYIAGLRAAIRAALRWTLEGICDELDPGRPVPEVLISQARRAARVGVSIEIVQQRYIVGAQVLGDFLRWEAAQVPIGMLDDVLRRQGEQLERVSAAVAAAHKDELQLIESSPGDLLMQKVRRLLTTVPVDLSDFGYRFDQRHVAFIATGAGAAETVGRISRLPGDEMLHVRDGEDTTWAWLGSRRKSSQDDFEQIIRDSRRDGLILAIGEWQRGLDGWRFSHRQAQAALEVALVSRAPVTRYREALVLAAVVRDDTALRSVRELYLDPLKDSRSDSATLCETLRAYLAADKHAQSAAAALGVERRTVKYRVREAELRLAQPIHECQTELALALQLDELELFAQRTLDT